MTESSNANHQNYAPSALEGCVLNSVYQVEEKIAHGGMAWVYRARHQRFGSPWAVKILFPHHAESPNVRERFLRESYIQHQLTHPNVVRVHDLIEERGVCGYVMEWCGEGDLRRLLVGYRGPLPLDQVAFIFDGIVSGVGYAHKRGIVHRDLKPENILIAMQGDQYIPRITDFGIAKVLEDVGHTDTGSAIGTFSYMSPEQFLDAKNIDERSDIYSLGVILYMITTGRLPFHFDKGAQANFLGMMLKVQHEPPPPIDELPLPLQQVIMRCLEKDAGARFQSCDDLLDGFRKACLASGIQPAALQLPDARGDLLGSLPSSVTPVPSSAVIPVHELSSEHTPLPTPDVLARADKAQHPETQENLPAAGATGEQRDAYDLAPTSPNRVPLFASLLLLGVLLLGGAVWLFRDKPKEPVASLPRIPEKRRVIVPRTVLPPVGLVKSHNRASSRMSAAQRRTYRQHFRKLAALLKEKRWRPAIILFESASKQRLDTIGMMELLMAMSEAFPQEVSVRLALLAKAPRSNAKSRSQILSHIESLRQRSSALRLVQETLRRRVVGLASQSSRAKASSLKAFQTSMGTALARFPTSTGLVRMQQDAFLRLVGHPDALKEAVVFGEWLYQRTLRAQSAGLLLWRRLWLPALWTPEQTKARVGRAKLARDLLSWAVGYKRDYMQARFFRLAKGHKMWEMLYRPSISTLAPAIRQRMTSLTTEPLRDHVALQPAMKMHTEVFRAKRDARIAEALAGLRRLINHIKAKRTFASPLRRRWVLALEQEHERILMQLLMQAKGARKRLHWKKASSLYSRFLQLAPQHHKASGVVKLLKLAKKCGRLPPDFLPSECR